MLKGEIIDKNEQHVEEFRQTLEHWGMKGKRILAFAMLRMQNSKFHKNFDFSIKNPNFAIKGLTFLGMVSLHDPPRRGVYRAIQKLKNAGIKVIMVTGDQETTAVEIGRQCKIISD